mgnify:FL=1
MRTKRWMATCVVALLSVAAVLAKDIRVVVFKVSQMHCENCEKKVKNNMRFEKGVKELSTELKNKTVSITYDAEKTDVKKLEGKWNIVEVKGEKILKEGLPNMEFDMKDNKVHGNAGCNIFNSTVVLDDQDISSITINPAATTMMACPDMEIEDAILKAMGNVKGVKAGQSENEMLLVDADGNVLMVLSKN